MYLHINCFWIHDSEAAFYSFFLWLRLYPLISIKLDYVLFHIYLNIFISANFPLPSFCTQIMRQASLTRTLLWQFMLFKLAIPVKLQTVF